MKPFSLEEALAGKSVVTRAGNRVTRLVNLGTELYPLVGAVEGYSEPQTFMLNGTFLNETSIYEGSRDLFMASAKITGWIAYGRYEYDVTRTLKGFATHVWPTEKLAKESFKAVNNEEAKGAVEVSWEE